MRKSKFFLNLRQIKNYWREKISSLDLDLILSDAINQPREFVITHPEFQPSPWKLLKIFVNNLRRANGTPLAYITGHKEFFGLDFLVNKNVLIPRPDTEILVESAIEAIFNLQSSITLIDIGTGSGCIPISILKTLQHKNIETHAIDISKKALQVAKKNSKKHNVEINFYQGNLLLPFFSVIPAKAGIQTVGHWIPGQARNDSHVIITANLPYLTNKQFTGEKSIQKEPKLALVADDKNGLSLYEKLLNQIKSQFTHCHPDENRDLCPITLLLEIDPSQTTDIYELIKNIFPSAKIEIKKDLAGHDRVVIIQ